MKPEDILKGNIQAAARLMRDIDDEIPSARDTLKHLFQRTGHAHIVGVTGSPGTGKSTLIDCLIQRLRENRKTVGVVAIDPTSPFSGGAILGDRVRMQRHTIDEGVFIRSLATRGHLGGLSRSTHDIVTVMDSMGKDVIIVETVGVGQDGVEIIHLAHTNIVVIIPGMGDSIQAIKAGILETGDIFVVNKADMGDADIALFEMETTIQMKRFQKGDWVPPVLKTDSSNNIGIKKLLDKIDQHKKYLETSFGKRQQQKRSAEMFEKILRDRLFQKTRNRLKGTQRWEETLNALKQREVDPYSAAESVVNDILKNTS
ncbi:MAG: methylmalonyl Co-A mutase-associated GTPase MeaB [Desulfobacterales bacterium]|jgi:LAO/AO transport system kinase|nr:methylmalonyl Co-A mutase-associated GTPase MeaB [Desulfobacter sp.]MDP6395287.1 methylmalonyl Co-A mutase-associated GTPase MeaB [Desulfobacterales bacterium]MDP6683574.1 methylmalonyl Co-A mutase-associated GTPase MeaB [Desulfobacterales bacterium]MDP6807905.1 methylmalonyl Co-A mutase-associated GTPase MeaB [Desulfobacterales bacterium]|tara:strand:+ start:69766 stop:70710 length:945 start_codon:yes stop_codon:yes gene_type:complete